MIKFSAAITLLALVMVASASHHHSSGPPSSHGASQPHTGPHPSHPTPNGQHAEGHATPASQPENSRSSLAQTAAGALGGAALGAGIASSLHRPIRETKSHESHDIIDLSHPLNDRTLHWPTSKEFKLTTTSDGDLPGLNGSSHYLRMDSFETGIHTGTHLDAPVHFSKNGTAVDQISLDRLVHVPVSIVDLSDKVKANRTYSFVAADFKDSKNVSFVRKDSVLLVYTGISANYSEGQKAYFGTESKNISEMRIPGFSKEAADYIVAQGAWGVGLDAPSADSSMQHGHDGKIDPLAHVTFATAGLYILENINNDLKKVVDMEARRLKPRLTILPLAITNASGSPVRIIVESTITEHGAATNSVAASFALARWLVVFHACVASVIIMRQHFV